MRWLFLLFVAVPLLDLWLLVQIGRALGFWSALALVVGTGVLGASLAKSEGFKVVHAWQRALGEGRLPEEGVLSGVLVIVGGLLLVTPGAITDAAGLALIFPPTRRVAARWLAGWARRRIEAGHLRVVTYSAGGPHRSGGGSQRGESPSEIDVTPPRSRGRLT